MNKGTHMSSDLLRHRPVAGLILLCLLAVAGGQLWNAWSGYRSLEAYQRALARHSLQGAARDIADHVEEQRKGLVLLADSQGELLSRLAGNPMDGALHWQLQDLLEFRFPAYYGHTLADAAGAVIEDLGEIAGAACREEIRRFAAGQPAPPMLHPGARRLHYDVMARWSARGGGGVLAVHFQVDGLARFLARNQVPGHRLLLVRAGDARLVEVTEAGGRDRVGGPARLSDDQWARIAAWGGQMPVKGTTWRVVDLPQPDLMALSRWALWLNLAGTGGAFLMLAGVILWATARDARRRRQIDAHARRGREELEARVAERTEALERSEENLRRAQAVSHTGSWSLRLPGGALEWSEETYLIFGLPFKARMDFERMLERVHPDDRAAVRGAWQEAHAGVAYDIEYRIQVGPRVKWVRERAELRFDAMGVPVAGVGTVQDITQRREAELALEAHQRNLEALVAARTGELEAAEAQLRLILESSADGIYGVDTDGRLIFVNSAACEMLGYPAEHMVGRPVHALIHHSHPDGSPYPARDCPMLAALHQGITIRQDQEVFWRADGHALPVAWASRPMLRQGRIVGAVVSFMDITALRPAEAARPRRVGAPERPADAMEGCLAEVARRARD